MEIEGIRFNRRELSGAFGDIGTDFPLIVAMILAAGLHSPSVLIIFGLMQILTGLVYRMPMPVQPLKAMATIVISQKIPGPVLFGGGLAIGITMLFLSVTGLLEKLARIVPKAVVRGIQFGLGVSLCTLALKEHIPADKTHGYILALLAFTIIVIFLDGKKLPVAFVVILLGILYSLIFKIDLQILKDSFGVNLPSLYVPTQEDIVQGFILLALPQIPLSLGNSIIATKQVAQDLFPEKNLSVKKIGFTYSLMNLIAPFFGGVPCCHGSGGMVGHYTFGGRTGGSTIIYGLFYLVLGLFFGNGFSEVVKAFPLPVLGVILVFEGMALSALIRDLKDKRDFVIALLVGLAAAGLPYGFVISILIGTIIYYSAVRFNVLGEIGENSAEKC
ncbi:MAG: transporter [Acidobacteria bacterium]|nr:MAG: transporter [Acidobacteriota bacterium]